PARPAPGQTSRPERRRLPRQRHPQPYKHRDLGFLVDLGGLAAAANPLNIPLSGPAANTLTRGYHLYTMSGNRMRVLTDWPDNAVTRMEVTSLDVISAKS